jgi:hypothetical protein
LFPFAEQGIRLPCAREIDIDTSYVNAPQQPAEKLRSPQVSRSVIVVMIIIVAALALVAIFANIQRLRRDQIETIVVVPAGSTTPQPR